MASSQRVTLASFKHKQLQRVAFFAGLNSSATKTNLLTDLPLQLQAPLLGARSEKRAEQSLRILSIDMGIRNLAYCMLEVNPQELGKHRLGPKNRQKGGGDDDRSMSRHGFRAEEMIKAVESYSTRADNGAKLLSWNRISLTSASGNPEAPKGFEREPGRGLYANAPGPDKDSLGETTKHSENLPVKEVQKESFEPASLASTAYKLIAQVILPLKPTHILIERQRYRSSGSSAILEWTVRVNMLEGMLHTVLETLKQTKLQKRPSKAIKSGRTDDESICPEVQSVSPKRVAKFWTTLMSSELNSLQTGKSSKKAATSKIEKEAKIAIAETWLRGNEQAKPLQCGSSDAKEMRDAFLAAREPRKNRTRPKERRTSTDVGERDEASKSVGSKKGIASLGSKLDDLADSLLQGMAWVQWEANRRKISEHLEFKNAEK